MTMSHQYKLNKLIIGASLALFLIVTGQASAIDLFARSTSGETLVNSYGECWQAIGGSKGGCGTPQAADTDQDGVSDTHDQCPYTPQGVLVDAAGCPLDTDGDGVADYKDNCLNSYPGDKVNANGCLDEIVLRNINFEFNRSDLTAQAKQILSPVAKALKVRPDIRSITVVGHTDSEGEEEYNQTLSESRANAVMNYFRRAGVTVVMKVIGRGEKFPLTDNATARGRAINRRVELGLN